MPQSDAGIKSMLQYRKRKSIEKLERLVDGKPKWKDEKYMDIKDIEKFNDKLLRIVDGVLDEDYIDEGVKVLLASLKFVEVKDKLQADDNPLDENVE